ncbi:hypothetical protein LGT41_0000920 [Abyssibius alkaniclasticus]|uniref:hypothetical protein n=1 Tax=Abyssibius alkaniclasticus TaxID=2881234 RepID=UPI002363D946|nr:hypothetical protein [Abyssibius alkaniclasticus]UPH71407.1 hypothetical protein LGT41_0000920 [Abyssibius alkaniclasticus]|tara:strand:+ start:138 stop:422 length:285 start_codon:yes stop_codon:yes gene_type:complete
MTTTQSIILGLQSLSFTLWAGLMFWTLFRLRRRAQAQARVENAGMFRQIALSVTTFGLFFKHPDFAPDRRRLALATLVMATAMVLFWWSVRDNS